MCGFLGFVSKENKESLLDESLDIIRHRGPDRKLAVVDKIDDNYLGLGHARLSIIDLSENATQPFFSACGNYSLVFNGEIYNYKELKEDLALQGYGFSTESDTEVLLSAWMAWGVKVLPRLIGMYSFVVYDRYAKKLTIVRDAFGIKPLFYSLHSGEGIVFGSDIRGVTNLRNDPVRPDLQRAYDYLVHGDYDSTDSTFVEGVNHVMPGHYFEYDVVTGSASAARPWWQPNISSTSPLSFDEAKIKLRDLFLESVRLHLRSDVALGSALSGGIDSSAVVCAIRHLEPHIPIHTFSYIASDEKISEEKWVDVINSKINAIEHKVYSDKEGLQQDLDDMMLMQGEPFGGTSIYAQYCVYKLFKENKIKVALDGQGADELLAGYSGYPGHRLLSIIESGGILKAHHYAKSWASLPGRSYFLAWKYLGRIKFPDWLYSFARKMMGRDFYPVWLDVEYLTEQGVSFGEKRALLARENKGKRVREALINSIQGRGLPSLLRHGDRNSMAFSIESRVPFLTIPMAEFLLSLPESYLLSEGGVTKHIFREALRGIVPDSHLDRKDKIGFETPEAEWLLGMFEVITRWVSEAPEVPFLNKAEILKELEEVLDGRIKFDGRVWRWINYIRWYTLIGAES